MLNSLFGRIKICNVIRTYQADSLNPEQVGKTEDALKKLLPEAIITFDLKDDKKLIRIENTPFDSDLVIEKLEELEIFCSLISDDILTDNLLNTSEQMHDFWDSAFLQHQTMWGFEPANSAIYAKDFFLQNGVENVLIPGIGYGRNAGLFIDNGIEVTGIEISETAIRLAAQKYGEELIIRQGSVTEMPFESRTYQSVFCYGLLHLLTPPQRKKMIHDCYSQLEEGGWMIFAVLSKKSPNYGKGRKIADDTFEVGNGGQIFFYDDQSVQEEFNQYGFTDFIEVDEQVNVRTQKPDFRFLMIKCRKPVNNKT